MEDLAHKTIHKTYRGLGTNIYLTAFGSAKVSDLDDSYALLQAYETALTVNRSTSELMDVNDAAGIKPVAVSDSTYQLTKLAIKTSQENFGFNALIGPLVKLWKIGFSGANVPPKEAIASQLSLIDPTQVELDDDKFTIFLKQAGMQLDLGAIAKGYIADRIQDLWAAKGISSGMINLGGNLLLKGLAPHHPDGLWRIGIQDPFTKRGNSILSVKYGPCSAVTSGIYERLLKTNGKTYHHILDPKTGYPHENNLASVTVFTKTSVQAEIETTRLFFADGPQLDWQPTSEVYGAIFITKDRTIQICGLEPADVFLLDDSFKLEFK
ncbi:FAD:protein FMN transferase [Ligilactobacillus animalis]|uniref:FAD:protein FMN transferase n=1 Tax=Ligilactobacillus animalis TaxID=1605 RepID=UPI00384C2130